MARQGNYVPNAGSNVNFASGLSSSLTDLSRSLLNQAQEKERLALQQEKLEQDKSQFATTEERQRANMLFDAAYKEQESKRTADYRAEQQRLAAEREANDQKWREAADRRAQKLFDRQQAQYEEEQAQKDWYKGLNDLDLFELKKQKAISLGFDPSSVSEEKAKEVINAVPFYQEDLTRSLGKDFQSQFGTSVDTGRLAPYTTGLSSLSTLQSNADAVTKARQEQANKAKEFELKALTRVFSSTPGAGSKKSGPKTVADISVTELAKPYQDNAWFNPLTSEKEDVANLTTNLLNNFQRPEFSNQFSAAEIEKGVKYALDRLTEGDNLDEINYDPSKAAALAFEGARIAQTVGNSGNEKELLNKLTTLASTGLETVEPVNVRQSKLDEWKKLLEPMVQPEESRLPVEQAVSQEVLPAPANSTEEPLPPTPQEVLTPKVTVTPETVPDNAVDRLINILGDVVDFGPGVETVVKAPNPRGKDRVITEYTPKQELSRELLELQQDIDRRQALLNRGGGGQMSRNNASILEQRKAARDALITRLRALSN